MDANPQHAQEAMELWGAYAREENARVPITFACDEQVWLKVSGHTFREFYADPEVHLKVQLEGRRWFYENVVGDTKPPGRWPVTVQLWMEEDEYFGCETVYQEDDYAWSRPLLMGREDLLAHLADLDPEAQVRKGRAFWMYEALKGLTEVLTFGGRPVEVVRPGGSTHGIFTKAAEIRGIDRICVDLYDDPDFVERLLQVVTEKTIGRIRAWHRLATGREAEGPSEGGFGFCDDSLQLISSAMYERMVLPWHERLYTAVTRGRRSLHLCGLSSQHYRTLRERLNVTSLDGPGIFADLGHYLKTLGPDFSFASARIDSSTLAQGTPAEIEGAMRKLLSPEAKIPGRFQVLGYVTRETPPENVRACYGAGRKWGAIEKG